MKVPFSVSSCRSREFDNTNNFRKSIRCCLNEFMKAPKKTFPEKKEMATIEGRSPNSSQNPIKHKMSFRSSTLPSKKRFRKIDTELDKSVCQSLMGFESLTTNPKTDNKINSSCDVIDTKVTSPRRTTPKKRFLGININRKRCQSLDSKVFQSVGNEFESGSIYSGRNFDSKRNISVNNMKRVKSLKLSKLKTSTKSSNAALCESRSPELTAVLCDKTLRLLFYKFLKGEHSEENLEFWVECELYRREERSFKKNGEGEKRQKMAKHLWSHFLDDSAPKQVNVPSSVRSPVQHSIKNNIIYRELFDVAQMHVFLMMDNDCLPRFQASLIYKKQNPSGPHSHLRGVRRHLKKNQQQNKKRPLSQQMKKVPSDANTSTPYKFKMPSFHL